MSFWSRFFGRAVPVKEQHSLSVPRQSSEKGYEPEVPLDSPSIETQIVDLKSEDFDTRLFAAEALGDSKNPLAVEPLIAYMKASSMHELRVACKALAKLGHIALKPVITQLSDTNELVRFHVVWVLADMGAMAIEALIASLNDEYELVRHYAAEALGNLGDARAVQPLTDHLQDNNSDVRIAVEEALRKLQPDRDLFAAVQNGKEALVQALLEQGVDVNQRNEDNYTPLAVAVGKSGSNVSIIKYLIAHGADLNAESKYKNSVLMDARDDILEMLVEDGADINSQNEDGYTALMFAASWGGDKFNRVKKLVELGASLDIVNRHGDTALMRACFEGYGAYSIELVLFLVERGANTNIRNKKGESALDIALRRQSPAAGIFSSLVRLTPQLPPSRQNRDVLTAAKLFAVAKRLDAESAAWPEILSELNSSNDATIRDLLDAIRGPHLFAPGVAMRVIQAGCEDVTRSNTEATAVEALAAARRSLDKIRGSDRY